MFRTSLVTLNLLVIIGNGEIKRTTKLLDDNGGFRRRGYPLPLGSTQPLLRGISQSCFMAEIVLPKSVRYVKNGRGGRVDAVVSAAGQAAFRPLLALTDADFALGLTNKLMGQVNLVRLGVELVANGGSFTLTSGIASRQPMPGGAVISLVNAGLEGFVRAAALELSRGVRVNAVAPGWVRETLVALKMDPSPGVPAAQVAQTYVRSVEGRMSGQVLDAIAGAG